MSTQDRTVVLGTPRERVIICHQHDMITGILMLSLEAGGVSLTSTLVRSHRTWPFLTLVGQPCHSILPMSVFLAKQTCCTFADVTHGRRQLGSAYGHEEDCHPHGLVDGGHLRH